jgi:hypothetical protein
MRATTPMNTPILPVNIVRIAATDMMTAPAAYATRFHVDGRGSHDILNSAPTLRSVNQIPGKRKGRLAFLDHIDGSRRGSDRLTSIRIDLHLGRPH